jgi:hypothetical protein
VRGASAAPVGYVETAIPLDAPPVGLAFGAGGVLYALEGAEFNSNEAVLRSINADGSYGNSFPVIGDDPNNFFVSAIGYDPISDRVLITDNTGDGRLYAVDSNGMRDTVASGIAGITAVAVRSSGEIFVSTAPFGSPGDVRLVDRVTGASHAVLSGLGFGAGIAFDLEGNLLVQDAAVTAPYGGRLQKLPIAESAAGLDFGSAMTLVEDTQAAAGVAVDSEGDIFITGSGGLFALEGMPLEAVSFSSNGNPSQFATAITFEAGVAPFELFSGPGGGRLAYMADFGFGMQDSFITILSPAAPEDFNSDGMVAGDDLTTWAAHFGTAPDGIQDGDSDNDGDVDGHDFLRWQQAVTAPSTTLSVAVPEANLVSLILPAALAGCWWMSRTGSRAMSR